MTIFVRAVITGFGLSLGAAIFKKVSKQLGFDEDPPKDQRRDPPVEATPEPV
jgi:hypothetical protein